VTKQAQTKSRRGAVAAGATASVALAVVARAEARPAFKHAFAAQLDTSIYLARPRFS
jgi:hypothetical protein